MQEQVINELTVNTDKMLSVERNILEATVNFRKELQSLKEKDAQLREAMLKAMEDSGTKSFENDLLKVTYVAPTSRTSVDGKTLEREMPEVFEQYKKETPVKGSVRITVKTIVKRVDI